MKYFLLTIGLTTLNLTLAPTTRASVAAGISLNPATQNLIISGDRASKLAQNDENRREFDRLESRIHETIDRYRQSRHLNRLAIEPLVSALAKAHSQEMAAKSFMSHDGFDRRADRLQSSISSKSASENVAFNKGHSQPEMVAIQDWLSSPGHLQNIIGTYNITGIGVARNSKGEYYFTQIFAKTSTWSYRKLPTTWAVARDTSLRQWE